MTQLGESQVVPLLPICMVGIFNVRIQGRATRPNRREDDHEAYPPHVAVPFVLTSCICSSVPGLLHRRISFHRRPPIAQPMKITPKLAAKRVAACFVCIALPPVHRLAGRSDPRSESTSIHGHLYLRGP